MSATASRLRGSGTVRTSGVLPDGRRPHPGRRSPPVATASDTGIPRLGRCRKAGAPPRSAAASPARERADGGPHRGWSVRQPFFFISDAAHEVPLRIPGWLRSLDQFHCPHQRDIAEKPCHITSKRSGVSLSEGLGPAGRHPIAEHQAVFREIDVRRESASRATSVPGTGNGSTAGGLAKQMKPATRPLNLMVQVLACTN